MNTIRIVLILLILCIAMLIGKTTINKTEKTPPKVLNSQTQEYKEIHN